MKFEINTHSDYVRAISALMLCNAAIEKAPDSAKPVFDGIAELHDAINRYECKAGVPTGEINLSEIAFLSLEDLST